MTAVLEALSRVSAPLPAVVVLIGAGDSVPFDMLEPWRGVRLILVEGDAEAASALRRQCAGIATIEVLPTAVAPQDGPLVWNRHGLSSLNGPIDWQALRTYYPRLDQAESAVVAARALDAVLDQCLAAGKTGEAAALLLDVPGQERTLLSSLSHQQLRRFEWIICRRCSALDGADDFKHLIAAGFRVQEDDRESEPLWPVATLRFDAITYALSEATARCSELVAERDAAGAQASEWRERSAALQSELAAAAQHADEWRQRAETCEQSEQITRRELATAHEQARSAGARLTLDLAAANERIAALTAETTRADADAAQQLQQARETADRLLAQAHAQIETLWHDKRELRATVDDQLVELEALRTQVHAASDQAAALRHSLDEELTHWRQRALEAESHLVADATPADPAVHAALERRIQELQAELRHQALRQQLLRDELNKAEGQVEVVKSLLLADMGL